LIPSLLLTLALLSPALHAEDVPLETCDGLPVVKVRVSEANFLFLVDTAATSMLNLKSFAHGDARKIAVTSWSGTVETKAQQIRLEELVIGAHHLKALNLSFADCLDPQVVIYTASGDYYGRDASMEYYRRRYFRRDPRAELQITPRGHHAIGDAIWVEYDLKIRMGQETILARGTALCEKQKDKWRIVHMNHSAPPADGLHASNAR